MNYVYNNIAGQRFGNAVAIKPTDKRKDHRIIWECLCDCGNTFYTLMGSLIQGRTKSCGCLRKKRLIEINHNRRLNGDEGSRNSLFMQYKKNAEIRNLPFELSWDEFGILTKQNCYYCGAEPKQVWQRRGYPVPYIYNGIDRVDTSRGYTLDNCVACCKPCNYSKGDVSIEIAKKMVQFVTE